MPGGVEFGEEFSTADPHPEKGGIRLTPYLTYNCLSISEDGQEDMYMSSLRTFWTCDICGLHLPLTFQEKAQHRRECEESRRDQERDQQTQLAEKMETGEEEHKKGSQKYFCNICKNYFFFTPVQILKHDRSCKSGNS